MALTRRRKAAAAVLVAALGFGGASTATAEETTAQTWQLRGKVSARGTASDARDLPTAVDLFHQAACRRATDLLTDGQPGRIKVEMKLWRQTGPPDSTHSRVPDVSCARRLERESAFRAEARVIAPRPNGGTSKSGALSLGEAVEVAARSANRIAGTVLETGREVTVTVVAATEQKRVRHMIKSLAIHYRLEADTAIRIAECESGLNPKAYNPPYAGVFQHSTRYWKKRAATYGHDGESVFDAYANVDVALQMARAGGWGPWGCA